MQAMIKLAFVPFSLLDQWKCRREFNWMQSEEEIDIIGELEDLVA